MRVSENGTCEGMKNVTVPTHGGFEQSIAKAVNGHQQILTTKAGDRQHGYYTYY